MNNKIFYTLFGWLCAAREGREVPGLMLVGEPGTGKTTLATFLASEIAGLYSVHNVVVSGIKHEPTLVFQTACRQGVLVLDKWPLDARDGLHFMAFLTGMKVTNQTGDGERQETVIPRVPVIVTCPTGEKVPLDVLSRFLVVDLEKPEFHRLSVDVLAQLKASMGRIL